MVKVNKKHSKEYKFIVKYYIDKINKINNGSEALFGDKLIDILVLRLKCMRDLYILNENNVSVKDKLFSIELALQEYKEYKFWLEKYINLNSADLSKLSEEEKQKIFDRFLDKKQKHWVKFFAELCKSFGNWIEV